MLFIRRVWGVALLLAAVGQPYLTAQVLLNITVRVLDSRTGQPVPHASIMALLDRVQGSYVWGHTDGAGIPYVEIGRGVSVMAIHADPTGTFQYTTCDAQKGWLFQTNWYAVSDIMKTGIVAANHCNKRTAVVGPGEFTLFVRPMHWWEKLRLNP
jgi:hypothetical protein